MITKISKNKDTIDKLLERSQILEKENRLDKYLCYVLVTELIFGAKKLNGESKPVLCVSGYEERFKEILAEIENGETSGEAGNSRQDGGKVDCEYKSVYGFSKRKIVIFLSKTTICANKYE